jgi:eukaryotic-like serine/threonine-protein kinase
MLAKIRQLGLRRWLVLAIIGILIFGCISLTRMLPARPPTRGVVSTKVSPKDSMLQMYVPAGDFLMGTTEDQMNAYSIMTHYVDWGNEGPQHSVYLDAFWIDQTEVTNAQYARCVASGQCTKPYDTKSYTRPSYFGDSQFADYPVIFVDWNQAQAYCAWAGRRLPSEAEWEKAARGPDGRTFPWGDAAPNQYLLNYHNYIGDTTAVGSYPSGASFYGALDMAGNVWEWVNDWYSQSWYQSYLATNPNPTGPDYGDLRVQRGGFWGNDDVYYVRSAYRYGNAPDFLAYDILDLWDLSIGFRCATSP